MAILMRATTAAMAMVALTLGACQTTRSAAPVTAAETAPPKAPASTSPTPALSSVPAPPPSPAPNGRISDLSAHDLQGVLAYLDKNHHDRMKLAFWVSTPLRSVDLAFKTFYKERGAAEKELANELESWAKSHQIDITYHYAPTTFGQAQKIMEDRQEKVVRGDGKDDFNRDMLVDELQDYEFGISLVTAVLPSVHDPALLAYLQKSLHSQEAASQQIKMLFKQFKYAG
jgi:hypothetical protein